MKAVADFNDAIRLDSDLTNGYWNRAFAWERLEEVDSAIDDYTEVIRLNPRFAPAYNWRGDQWFKKRDYDKAIADYDAAVVVIRTNFSTSRIVVTLVVLKVNGTKQLLTSPAS